MRLLYIADNGFSIHKGVFYYTRPNDVNTSQYMRYFSEISYIARRSAYCGKEIKINSSCKVKLVGRYDIIGLSKAMKSLCDDFDTVVVRSGFLGCFAAIFAKLMGKTLISFSGSDPYELYMSKQSFWGSVVAYFWRRLEANKMKIADYAHYCTSVLYDRYPCNCPYLVCSDANVVVEGNTLKKRINKIMSGNNMFVIGLIGNYVKNDNKGISYAIRALGELDDNYQLEVVGYGNPDKYKKLVDKLGLKSRVFFKGYFQDKAIIDDWLDNIDVYIQPSMSEGLSRATIEAMARACPVISSDVCGFRELLPEEWMVRPRDYKVLASAIEKMSNKDKMKHAAERNFRIASNYTAEKRDKKMDAFYSMIINR